LKVAVLGVGLIGGSIGLAAKRRAGAEISGFDPDERVLEHALARDAIDSPAADVPAAVLGAQVVFVAAPVGALAETVQLALQSADADCVVSDVGSTKRVVEAAGADERFIGGHPLAGAETAGVDNAREDLFDGATWYLTPAQGNTAGVLYERLHGLLRRIGAQPRAIDAGEHDRLLACVSHLPHVLANVLAEQAHDLTASGERGRLLAVGPSFRDWVRVAGANSAIWPDIYLSNRDALVQSIDAFAAGLDEARAMLVGGDRQAVTAWNDAAREDRAAVLDAAGDAGPLHELRASVPNRPGVIADIALALGRAGVNIADMALSPSPDNSQGVVSLWVSGDEQAVQALALIAGLGFPVAET
jgi:prephenate dehydrogenase